MTKDKPQRLLVERFKRRPGSLISKWDIETMDGVFLYAKFFGGKLKLCRTFFADSGAMQASDFSGAVLVVVKINRVDGFLSTGAMQNALSKVLDWSEAVDEIAEEARQIIVNKTAQVGMSTFVGDAMKGSCMGGSEMPPVTDSELGEVPSDD